MAALHLSGCTHTLYVTVIFYPTQLVVALPLGKKIISNHFY